MTMPTSIFSYLPSVNPVSVANKLTNTFASGLPQPVGSALSSGLAGVLNNIPGFGHQDSVNNTQTPLTVFLEDVKNNGIAWASRFYCRIQPPPLIQELINQSNGLGPQSIDPQRLLLRCEAAELPGTTYTGSSIRFNGGPSFQVPSSVGYTDLNLQFFLSADMVEKYFFDYWSYLIKDSSDMYAYYDDIKTDIELTLFTNQYAKVYGVKFFDAWPVATSPIQLSWEDQNMMRLNVTFTYSRWVTVPYPPPTYATPGVVDPGSIGSNILRQFLSTVVPSLPGVSTIIGLSGGTLTPGNLLGSGTAMLGGAINKVEGAVSGAVQTGVSTLFGG